MKFWIIVLPFCSILNFIPVVELIFLVRILGLHHNHILTCFPNLLTGFFFFFGQIRFRVITKGVYQQVSLFRLFYKHLTCKRTSKQHSVFPYFSVSPLHSKNTHMDSISHISFSSFFELYRTQENLGIFQQLTNGCN